jgi:phage-related protein
MLDTAKQVFWMGSSLRDIHDFPEEVRGRMGFAIYVAQTGGKHRDAKPLKGFGGAGVLEVVTDHDTFRSVYTVTFRNAVYVLHAFQKKSRSGIATSKADIETINRRYREAERHAKGP